MPVICQDDQESCLVTYYDVLLLTETVIVKTRANVSYYGGGKQQRPDPEGHECS